MAINLPQKKKKKKHGAQNENDVLERKPRVSDIIAEEQGVNHSTVIRSEHFAKGIDAIRESSANVADDILAGKRRDITNKTVQQIGTAKPDERSSLVQSVVSVPPKKRGRHPKAKEDKPKEKPFPKKIYPGTKRGQEIIESIRESIRNLEEGVATENTVDVFCQNLQYDVSDWIRSLNDALIENKSRINAKVESNIINAIKSLTSLKEVLENA